VVKMLLLPALVLCVSISAIHGGSQCGVSNVKGNASDWRIVGGVETKPLEFPWQVSVKDPYDGTDHNCGGTIISDQWILTAAHCDETKVIVMGDHDFAKREGTEVQIPIVKWIIHPKMTSYEEYDLALVKLEKKLDFEGEHKHLAPVCLATPEDDQKFAAPGTTCTVSGWGYIDNRGGTLPDTLHKVDVPVWANDECKEEFNQLTDKHICTRRSGIHSTCAGDSGGPLQCKKDDGSFVQVGTVSYSLPDCQSDPKPSVFTRVSSYHDWIMETIANE